MSTTHMYMTRPEYNKMMERRHKKQRLMNIYGAGAIGAGIIGAPFSNGLTLPLVLLGAGLPIATASRTRSMERAEGQGKYFKENLTWPFGEKDRWIDGLPLEPSLLITKR